MEIINRDGWKVFNNELEHKLVFQIITDDEYVMDVLRISYNLLNVTAHTKNDKRITVLETENWMIQNDYKNHQVIISYFEACHFVNDILIEHDYLLKLIQSN